jgi:hypothetical protein
MLCDIHVNRMLVEACQLLASAYWYEVGVKTKKELAHDRKRQGLANLVFAEFPRRHETEELDERYQYLARNPYAPTHLNHPCAIWTRRSRENFDWLCAHAKGLATEFAYRYGKVHACEAVVDWFAGTPPTGVLDPQEADTMRTLCETAKLTYQPVFLERGLTPFVQALPEDLRGEDAVLAYRQYYSAYKREFAVWNKTRAAPDWF